MVTCTWQQNRRFCPTTVSSRWEMCCETVSYHPMHLQTASQLENWMWYYYLSLLSFRRIGTVSRSEKTEKVCLLPQVMVYLVYTNRYGREQDQRCLSLSA